MGSRRPQNTLNRAIISAFLLLLPTVVSFGDKDCGAQIHIVIIITTIIIVARGGS